MKAHPIIAVTADVRARHFTEWSCALCVYHFDEIAWGWRPHGDDDLDSTKGGTDGRGGNASPTQVTLSHTVKPPPATARRGLSLIALALLSGCGEDVTINPPPDQLSFDVAPELEASVRAGLQRWEQATGIRRTLSDEGIPVHVEDDPDCRSTREIEEGVEPRPCNGGTNRAVDTGAVYRIRIRASLLGDPDYLATVVAHELGHALGAEEHAESERDLMHQYAGSHGATRITDEALTLLCEAAPCARFQPEEE